MSIIIRLSPTHSCRGPGGASSCWVSFIHRDALSAQARGDLQSAYDESPADDGSPAAEELDPHQCDGRIHEGYDCYCVLRAAFSFMLAQCFFVFRLPFFWRVMKFLVTISCCFVCVFVPLIGLSLEVCSELGEILCMQLMFCACTCLHVCCRDTVN